MDLSRQPMDEAAFRAAHAADRMAREKLDEGIAGFSKAILAFEKLLEARHGATPTAGEAGRAAGRFFELYDPRRRHHARGVGRGRRLRGARPRRRRPDHAAGAGRRPRRRAPARAHAVGLTPARRRCGAA